VVKVAMSENGLEAISRFAEEGIKTNCTLIFTANQGLSPPRQAPRSSARSSGGSTTSTRTG
jgi:transaldolase